MPNTILLAVAVAVAFTGCAILFLDAIATKKSDFCQAETPAEYIGKNLKGQMGPDTKSQLLVLATPEFRYEYEGNAYQGRSANVFFHFYLRAGRLAVPFLEGKTYRIYVNPAQPTLYVTSGEQRFAFMHILGCSISAVGVSLLLFALGFFG